MGIYRHISIAIGLIPDLEDFNFSCCDSHGKQNASSVELELASRTHRWASMKKIQADFFNSLMDLVTEAEKNILEGLGMPDIDTVRMIAAGEQIQSQELYVLTAAHKRTIDTVFTEWEQDIVGKNEAAKQEEEETESPIYQLFQNFAFAAGFKKFLEMAKANLPAGVDPAILDRILLNYQNEYLNAIKRDGLSRISAALTKRFKQKALDILIQATKDQDTVWAAAKKIHGKVLEGQAWWWNRLARSESTLAANAAFSAISRQAGVTFEQWSAAGNACPICTAFDGRIWRLDEGPSPVADTHPHCLCYRIPLYNTTESIQDRWERASPYDQPYSSRPEEMRQELSELLG